MIKNISENSGKSEKIKKLFKTNYYQIIIVFVAFAAMILVSSLYVNSIVSNQMHSLGLQIIETTKTAVSKDLETAELLFSDVVRTSRKMIEEKQSNEEILVYLTDIQEFYSSPDTPMPEFLKIYGVFEGKFLDGSDWTPPSDYVPSSRPWYIGAAEANGKIFFSEPYLDADTNEMCISFSQRVGAGLDILAIDLDLSSITDYIREQKITNNGYGVLISDRFTFAAHKDDKMINKSMEEAGDGFKKLEGMIAAGEEISGVRFIDSDKTESVAFFMTLFNGWHIGIITPYNSFVHESTNLTIVICILGIVLAAVLSALLLYTAYQKMKSDEESLSKSTFLARMSHEMRTPMNAIIGMTDIARKTNDPQKIQNCINKISDASTHLLGVINDVLDMSKIEAGKLELSTEEFSFNDMIRQVRTVAEFKIEERKQEFSINIDENVPQIIISDKQRLAQVITNLLSNASKFTPEGGTIRLNVFKTAENELLFEVIDSGIGISKEQQVKLFQSFEQADNSISRKFGGTGLGLAICKKIIELMDGKIGLESELGKGSKFFFNIKIGIAEQTHTEVKQVNMPESIEGLFKNKRILIAEDVEINREIIVELLTETGADLEFAENGRIVLEKFNASPDSFDLILMDIHMPEMDGLEATRQIRAINSEKAKNIPIIAMTANVFKEDIENCRLAGMNAHTGKPIEFDDLITKILTFI